MVVCLKLSRLDGKFAQDTKECVILATTKLTFLIWTQVKSLDYLVTLAGVDFYRCLDLA